MKSIVSTILCSAPFLTSALPPLAEAQIAIPLRQLSVRPAQVTEGNSFRQSFEIVVPPTLDFVFELRQPSATPVTGTYGVRPGRLSPEFGPGDNTIIFNSGISGESPYAPATNGTYFTPGADFTQVTGVSFTIPTGSTSITVKVPVFPDYQDEPDEYVQLVIESVSGISSTLVVGISAAGIITDDDEPPPAVLPTLTMTSLVVFEGTKPPLPVFLNQPNKFNFTVRVSQPSPAAITGVVNTAPLSGPAAESGVDFTPLTNAFFGIPPNSTTGTISVTILPDSLIEPQEYLSVTLSNIIGAQPTSLSAQGGIRNDDGPPIISVTDVTVTEPTGGPVFYRNANFRVSLSHPNYFGDTTVKYATRNGSAIAGTAAVPRDYDPVAGTLVLPPNQLLGIIQVPVRGDALSEGTEQFFIDFSNPVNATLPDRLSVGTILPPIQPTGLFTLALPGERVPVDEVVYFSLEWTVPEGKVWRDLESIDLRLRNGNRTAFWARWDEASDTFVLVEKGAQPRKKHGNGRKSFNGPSAGDPAGDPAQPGDDADLETREARLHLLGTSVEGSGPAGTSVTLNLAMSFTDKAAMRTYLVELAATGDSGDEDTFVTAGNVLIGPRKR